MYSIDAGSLSSHYHLHSDHRGAQRDHRGVTTIVSALLRLGIFGLHRVGEIPARSRISRRNDDRDALWSARLELADSSKRRSNTREGMAGAFWGCSRGRGWVNRHARVQGTNAVLCTGTVDLGCELGQVIVDDFNLRLGVCGVRGLD